MKKICLSLIMLLALVFSANSQNRWNIYAGGSISHLCEEASAISSDQSYGWGGGAFIGAGYEINFNSHWSLTPQLEFRFINNGATTDGYSHPGSFYPNSSVFQFYSNHSEWNRTFSINIPVIASYRFSISEGLGMRFGAGVYLQELLAGKKYYYDYFNNHNDEVYKDKISGNFGERLNVGAVAEVALETGKHFSYMFRAQFPFLEKYHTRNTLTLSLGLRYSF